jgi:hypothetical protein
MVRVKSVAEKARVKPDTRIAVLNGVRDIVTALGLPKSVTFVKPGQAQIVFLFARSGADLESRMPAAVGSMAPGAALWVFFRKGSKAAGLSMNRNDVWAVADRLGLRPLGLVSVDETWSAFRFKQGDGRRSS